MKEKKKTEFEIGLANVMRTITNERYTAIKKLRSFAHLHTPDAVYQHNLLRGYIKELSNLHKQVMRQKQAYYKLTYKKQQDEATKC